MAFSLTCPHCDARLKTASPVAAGKSVACPKCKGVFESGGPEDEDAPPRKAAAKAPAGKAGGNSSASSSSRRPRPAEDDYEVVEDEKPKRGRDEDDEDEEEPRARRKPARPAKDEGESRPRKKRPDEADDGEAPKPRLKKKKKKKKNSVLFWLLLAFIGLAAAGGAVFLVMFLISSAEINLLSYAPAESKIVLGFDLETLMGNDQYKGQVGGIFQGPQGGPLRNALQQAGLTEADLAQVAMAAPSVQALGTFQGDTVLMVRLKSGKTFDSEKIKNALRASEVQKEGKNVLKAQGLCVTFPSPQVAVLCPSEATMGKILVKGGKEVALTGEFKDLAKSVNGNTFWMAATGDGIPPELNLVVGPFLRGDNPFAGAKMFGAWARVTGDKTQFEISVMCANADLAARAADALNKLVAGNDAITAKNNSTTLKLAGHETKESAKGNKSLGSIFGRGFR